MQYLNYIYDFLILPYFFASLINIIFTDKFLKQDFTTIQNIIGLVLIIGIGLYILIILLEFFNGWYSGVEYEQFTFLNTESLTTGRLILTFYPVLMLIINIFRRFRTNKIIVLITSLHYLTRFYELIIVLSVSRVTLRTINHDYLIPIVKMVVYGIILYFAILLFYRFRKKTFANKGS